MPGAVCKAARCVLQALVFMHKKKVVHRDVRWPKVIRLPDGSYALVDLECMGRLGGPAMDVRCTRTLQAWQVHEADAPGALTADGRFDAMSDLWCLGKMLDECKAARQDAAMGPWIQGLLAKHFGTAKAVLEHSPVKVAK